MPTQHTTPPSMLRLLRGLIPNRRVGKHELDRIAELQANKLRKHLDADESMLDTHSIVSLPRIRVLADGGLPTSGMSFWNGSEWLILLNPSEPHTRQRFSLLHELHHIICHTHRTHLFGAAASKNAHDAERMADYFAACALMPKMHVKRLFGHGYQTPTTLAVRFDVSAQAMEYRLDQLGLNTQPARRGNSYTRSNTSTHEGVCS